MLHRASEHMKHESRKKSRKHHAGKWFSPAATNSAGYNGAAQLGKSIINSGVKNGSIGYNADQQGGEFNTKLARKARKHESRRRSHKSRKHHSIMGLSESRKHESHRSHKARKHARHHAQAYRGGEPTQHEFGKGLHLSRKRSHKAHRAHKLPHLKPKGKVGRAQTGRLNRNFKTGGFNKIASAAGKRYGSTAAGKRVAGAIFHKMAESRGNAARKGHHAHRSHKAHKSYAHKGHTHRSRKAMEEC